METDHLLKALDFNSVHSGDGIARVYYANSARIIRRLERAADHTRRLYEAETARRVEAETDSATMASILGRIMDATQDDPAPQPRSERE